MTDSPNGLPYRFVQASWDYGRSETRKRAVVFHMAEGDDPLGYLRQRPGEEPRAPRILRGVSATFVCQPDGEVVQMLDLRNVSGSLNPRDVRTSMEPRGRWGRRYTRFLGKVTDGRLEGGANLLTWSIECGGYAKDGPNQKQIASITALVERLRAKVEDRAVGFTLHRDFADYKSCPGWARGIRALIEALGHGDEPVTGPPEGEDDAGDQGPCADMQVAYEAEKTARIAAEDEIARMALDTEAYLRSVADVVADIRGGLRRLVPKSHE